MDYPILWPTKKTTRRDVERIYRPRPVIDNSTRLLCGFSATNLHVPQASESAGMWQDCRADEGQPLESGFWPSRKLQWAGTMSDIPTEQQLGVIKSANPPIVFRHIHTVLRTRTLFPSISIHPTTATE